MPLTLSTQKHKTKQDRQNETLKIKSFFGCNDNKQELKTGNNPQGTPNDDTTATSPATPRGIAAIPLLCAAAAESRTAYLRRMANTSLPTGWWSRQEPLCATPGTLLALPEGSLLGVATLVEYLTLSPAAATTTTLQSFLWPTHNVCLALWMVVIMLYTIIGSGWTLISTILWGSRRTGMTLAGIWADEIQPASSSVHTLCELHQPIAVRLVGDRKSVV